MVGRERVACRGAGISWPCNPEAVKLEVDKMSRKEEAHIFGTKYILFIMLQVKYLPLMAPPDHR